MLNYQTFNKTIYAVHNGNSVISYYSLSSIIDHPARFQKFTIFSSIDLRSGYYYIGLTPEAKPETAFVMNGKWHWNIVSFDTCSLQVFSAILCCRYCSGLDFCLTYLDDILFYSTSWKGHMQFLEMAFKHLKEANVEIQLSKCQFLRKHLHSLDHLISKHGIQPLPEKYQE